MDRESCSSFVFSLNFLTAYEPRIIMCYCSATKRVGVSKATQAVDPSLLQLARHTASLSPVATRRFLRRLRVIQAERARLWRWPEPGHVCSSTQHDVPVSVFPAAALEIFEEGNVPLPGFCWVKHCHSKLAFARFMPTGKVSDSLDVLEIRLWSLVYFALFFEAS